LRQAGWLNPSKFVPQGTETGGSIHRFLWQWSHAVSCAKQELCGEKRTETVSSRVKYLKLVSSLGESQLPRG